MEALIAYHCAPALAGIKAANIVSCSKIDIGDVHNRLAKLNRQMNCKDIYFDVLNECKNSVLVMVYRKKNLKKTLEQSEIKIFLNSFGYLQFYQVTQHYAPMVFVQQPVAQIQYQSKSLNLMNVYNGIIDISDEKVSNLDYLYKKQNIVIVGEVATGKTSLAT